MSTLFAEPLPNTAEAARRRALDAVPGHPMPTDERRLHDALSMIRDYSDRGSTFLELGGFWLDEKNPASLWCREQLRELGYKVERGRWDGDVWTLRISWKEPV